MREMDKQPILEEDGSKKLPCLGTRHLVMFMGFLGFANVYAMRVNLSVAIVEMVNQTAIPHDNKTQDHSSCPVPAGSNTTSSGGHNDHNHKFIWDEETQGNVLGMFFYGYVLTQIPAGYLADIFGGKWLFGIGILVTAIFTLLTPIAANTNIYLLYAVRIIEGLGEGVTFPAMCAMLARWARPSERSRFAAFVYAGTNFGTVISMPLSGYMCDYFGWESVFYGFGAVGIVWFVGWAILVSDKPDNHPRISEEEKAAIMSSLIESETAKPKSIPYLAILKSPAVWAIAATHVTQNFGFYVLLTDLPNYMQNVLNFDIKSNGILSGVPYLVSWIAAIVASQLTDLIIAKEILSTTVTRKLMNSIATMGPALALVGAAFSGCHTTLTVVLLTLAVGSNGVIYCGEQSSMLDIANNYSGLLMGVINALGNIMGFVAPLVVGWITQGHNDVKHWQIVFFIAAVTNTVGNLFFVIFGSSVEQKWNRNVV